MNTLVIDIGGTHIKVRATGHRKIVKIPSGPTLTPEAMVRTVGEAVRGWEFSRISIGYPGAVAHSRPVTEPAHLGRGWVGFDFARAFGRPVRILNDAAMQALGSYRGGRMLFLGLGTGMGSALIVDGVLAPMELAHLPYKKGKTYEDYVGKRSLQRRGRRKWRRHVLDITRRFKAALEADYVVLGGGNVRLLSRLPRGVRRGDNARAFAGGFRLWEAAGTSRRSR